MNGGWWRGGSGRSFTESTELIPHSYRDMIGHETFIRLCRARNRLREVCGRKLTINEIAREPNQGQALPFASFEALLKPNQGQALPFASFEALLTMRLTRETESPNAPAMSVMLC